MALREDLQKRIDRKLEETRELELKIRENQAYIQGLQDTLKMLPRDPQFSSAPILRPGTDLAKAREFIRLNGRPLHISELLKLMGKPVNKVNRAGLSGNLAAYVRRNEVFTRPAPNTFGLVEMEGLAGVAYTSAPPSNFGVVKEVSGDNVREDDSPT